MKEPDARINVNGYSLLILIFGFLCVHAANGQTNLGFESDADGKPAQWFVRGEGYTVIIDDTVSFKGAKSLRISRTLTGDSERTNFGVASQSLDAAALEGDQIRISAAVKTQGITEGYAGLWLRVDNRDGTFVLDNMFDRPISGTNDWQRVRLTALIPPDAERIVFGALLPGTGTAWFDDFSVDMINTLDLPPPSDDVAAYIETALNIMEEHSIRREAIDWEEFRSVTWRSARGIESIADSYRILRAAIGRLGDNHSALFPPPLAERFRGAETSDVMPWIAPAGSQLSDGIGYVLVPMFGGVNQERTTRYADEMQDVIAGVDSPGVCGWVVDLRQNGGGNVFPMLAGIGPILGEGDAGGGITADGTRIMRWYRQGESGSLENVQASVSREPYYLHNQDPPVAVLIGQQTASSGEATALAFIGRSNARSFGMPSAGFTTGNAPHPLEDGAILNLAGTIMVDRNGQPYGDKIQPDEQLAESESMLPIIDQPVVRRAMSWLSEEYDCR